MQLVERMFPFGSFVRIWTCTKHSGNTVLSPDCDWSRFVQGRRDPTQCGLKFMMIVTGVVMNRDDMADALQQSQIDFCAAVQSDAPVQCGTQVNLEVDIHDDRNRCRHGSRKLPYVLSYFQRGHCLCSLEVCRVGVCDSVHFSIACRGLYFSNPCSVCCVSPCSALHQSCRGVSSTCQCSTQRQCSRGVATEKCVSPA